MLQCLVSVVVVGFSFAGSISRWKPNAALFSLNGSGPAACDADAILPLVANRRWSELVQSYGRAG